MKRENTRRKDDRHLGPWSTERHRRSGKTSANAFAAFESQSYIDDKSWQQFQNSSPKGKIKTNCGKRNRKKMRCAYISIWIDPAGISRASKISICSEKVHTKPNASCFPFRQRRVYLLSLCVCRIPFFVGVVVVIVIVVVFDVCWPDFHFCPVSDGSNGVRTTTRHTTTTALRPT